MDAKRMTLVMLTLALAVLFALPAAAQEIFTQARNQLEASHNTETDQDIFEDWFDLDLYGEGFLLGIRYSSFSPPDPVVSTDGIASEGITHRYAEIEFDDSRLRAGTFTHLIGRGLSFRSYKSRDLRIDTNLDGLLIEHSAANWRGALFTGRTESGQMESGIRIRDNRFSGLDADYNYGLLNLGAAFLTLERPGSDARPEIHGLRATLIDGPLQLDWEGVRLLHDEEGLDHGIGNVVEMSYLAGPFTFYGGYKHYENVALMTHDQKLMNQPPVLIHDQRATLLGRHPHQLDPDDEKGYLLDLSVSTPVGNFLASYAETKSVDGVLGGNDYRETFLEWDTQGFAGLDQIHGIVDFQQVPFLEPEGWVWEYFFSTAFDLHFGALAGDVGLIWEHQHKSADHVGDYDDELFTVDYTAPAGWTLSVIGEWVGWDEEQQVIELQTKERQWWRGVQLATPIGDHHDLRIFAGGRREGFICIGGVCRFEPAFDGVELMFSSRF